MRWSPLNQRGLGCQSGFRKEKAHQLKRNPRRTTGQKASTGRCPSNLLLVIEKNWQRMACLPRHLGHPAVQGILRNFVSFFALFCPPCRGQESRAFLLCVTCLKLSKIDWNCSLIKLTQTDWNWLKSSQNWLTIPRGGKLQEKSTKNGPQDFAGKVGHHNSQLRPEGRNRSGETRLRGPEVLGPPRGLRIRPLVSVIRGLGNPSAGAWRGVSVLKGAGNEGGPLRGPEEAPFSRMSSEWLPTLGFLPSGHR